MQIAPRLVSDPFLLFSSNCGSKASISPIVPSFFAPSPHRSFRSRKPIVSAVNKRKRYAFDRSGKIMLESACAIASKLGLLPPPLVLLLREFGGGNGGGIGFWDGFGWGDFDGWRRRKSKLGVMGILSVCCLGLWVVLGKKMVIDVDFLLGGIGLLLFGLSVNGWRKRFKDWMLGFCCCAFLGCLVLKKVEFRTLVKSFGTVKKNIRRKRSVF